jgi:hypothetical protein
MAWVVAIILIAAAVIAFFWLKRRGTSDVPTLRAGPQLEPAADNPQPNYWGRKLVVPSPDVACEAAKALQGKCYPGSEGPDLPLSDCDAKMKCLCHYEPLPERRREERRSGHDRREELRFDADKPDRRSGTDRRASGHRWDTTI